MCDDRELFFQIEFLVDQKGDSSLERGFGWEAFEPFYGGSDGTANAFEVCFYSDGRQMQIVKRLIANLFYQGLA